MVPEYHIIYFYEKLKYNEKQNIYKELTYLWSEKIPIVWKQHIIDSGTNTFNSDSFKHSPIAKGP